MSYTVLVFPTYWGKYSWQVTSCAWENYGQGLVQVFKTLKVDKHVLYKMNSSLDVMDIFDRFRKINVLKNS